MTNYTVSFIQYYNVTVEAETEEEAINIAEEIYGDTYDEVEVWEN